MTNRATIDAVSDAMASIVTAATARDSPIGYFAAMYLGVTRVVRGDLDRGVFATPDRLVTLTSVFAHRYVDAWHRYDARAGDSPTAATPANTPAGRGGDTPPSTSWKVAFDAAAAWRPTVLQHLLLGMNAHINYDLGVACAQVAPGDAIDGLRSDFDTINAVLGAHVRSIQGQLNRISPLYRFVDDVSGSIDRAVINFSIARARTEAWKLALFLARADPSAAAARLAEHDRIVRMIGTTIVHPGPFASSGLLALRLTERRNPRTIIDVLSTPA